VAAETADIGARTDRRARPPQPRTSFVGRGDDLAALIAALRSSDASLITITGRSGSGKSRLALEAARRVGLDLPGGAVLVNTNDVPEVALLGTAVAAALDITAAPGQEPSAAIARELQYQATLLILDDIDHLALAGDWLQALINDAPETRIVVTAKTPMHVDGERVIRVTPLTVADERSASEDELRASDAVTLFVDRASAVQHGFRLDRSNLRDVAELCRRLDGLPLAIELAAARSPTLSPGAQLRLLGRGSALDMRTGPDRGASPKGRLREAIALSYDLVGEEAQSTLRRMSVFEGAVPIEALIAVCSPELGEGDFLDRLTTLVDAHLVEADNSTVEPRFSLLPMIRDYSREMLIAADELDASDARQDDYYVAFARSTARQMEQEQILALARERANLELVLSRLIKAHETVRAARLAADLGWLWDRYGWFPVAQGWLDELIARGESDRSLDAETRALPLIWWVRLSIQHPAAVERAELIAKRQTEALELARASGSIDTILLALTAVYFSLLITHDVAASAAAAGEGLKLARESRDERWMARFEVSAGVMQAQRGDHETAAALASSALERSRRMGDVAGFLAPVLMLRGAGIALGREVVENLPTSEELLVMTRDLGDVRGEGWVLASLASHALARGDAPAAVGWAIQGLELGRRTGYWDASGMAMAHLSQIAMSTDDGAAVAQLYGSIERVMPELAISMSTDALAAYHAAIDGVRERFGASNFDRIARGASQQSWDGATLSALEYARRLAVAGSAEAPARPEPSASQAASELAVSAPARPSTPLTAREKDVLSLLATGATNNEIAAELGLSAKTVMHHSVSIYSKLGVRGRAEATAWAFRNGVAAPLAP
jgi:predicted ATPase/DNA-binding CsgD family transcriptional regulator